MPNNSIDMAFIAQLEGGSATRGYVPDPENSRSGVTIGTGFDLGQQKDLTMLPKDLSDRLLPYLGLIGAEAVARLERLPLNVSAEDARRIDEAYKAPFIERLASDYSKAAGRPFDALPAPMQTVIASVAFQYGNLASRTPKFWAQVVAADWNAAESNLRNFGDRYSTRRCKEAALLASAL
ncbi:MULTISPECIES: pesticin C-terminus-like muramidase [Pseudomonas]|jgi:GH24 family phage-related lysozyme (muramidase)|uniref:Peptidase n=1 Tax=Pseudomonas simiae TaxID=321846 RepID=A0A1N7TZE0_9PSED|nr:MULTISPECIES: pesticin C-terminus-like muramidase [Pseudomonas]AIB37600.1 peptidase [Pseudomonas simiae]MBC3961923.1 peptidase [Pseudomonas simiae]MBI6613272.1 peptidase [Pseudomonas simiae]PRW87637.1 peptidase [Pseudomonas simiae]UNK64735.1 pesticin C-terminus-like muramidase [Pseudomonas simiae]